MIVWHANLGRGVTTSVFESNLERVLRAGGKRAVFCFQEIDEADTPHEMLILRRLTQHTHHIVGQNTAVPILVPHHLPLAAAHVTPACKGLAKFTPNRVVNEAVIQLGPRFAVAVLNTHLPLNRPQTFTRRREVRHALRDRANDHPAGIWVADTNTRVGWPRIARGEQVVTNAGIDKAKAWGPEDRSLEIWDRQSVELGIDNHNAHGARVRWVRR